MSDTLTQLEAADFINRSFKPLPRTYGDALIEAANKDPRIVALCADLVPPTETDRFRDELPDRFHNVGIAEANMIGMAGGMARSGEIPFCHSFCAFITKRVLDQITLQAAYPNLPVKIVGFLPGVATLLGVSHQAIEDVAIMRAVPNMAIFEPSGPEYHAAMVKLALDWDGPAYLRMKRPETMPDAFEPQSLEIGKGVIRRAGRDLTIISAGLCVSEALQAADTLATEGVEARVVDMASLKPIDQGLILESAAQTGAIVTAENHSIIGGLGSAVAEVLMDEGVGLPFKRVGIQDRFCEGGTTPYLMNKFGLDAVAIAQAARGVMQKKKG
ncbi:MAG: transketolase C-terminal domain-containing protein [Tateyamaria sp.]|uniref:transketolase family protein n=1 Tax=Tateyamaria sp. TaxID=1929288 RepID=UPI00329FFFB7